jgi:hypothetical protein
MHSMFFPNTPILQVPDLVNPLLAGLLNGFQAYWSPLLDRVVGASTFHVVMNQSKM